MTMQTFSANLSAFTTDAAFRAWGLGCSTALQACGLVLTADTGQINWATVTKPTTTGTKAGYEIYRFADTLQATKPVFIRFDYGSSSVTSGNSPATWITIGTSTNGAGTITGGAVVGPFSNGAYTVSPANVAATCQFTHSTANGYLLANFGIAITSASGLASTVTAGVFVLERTKDATGAPTGDGLNLVYAATGNSSNVWNNVALNFNTGSAITSVVSPLIGPLASSVSLSTSGVAALYRQYAWIGSLFYSVGLVGYYSTDQLNGATFTATPVGSTSHNYYCWTSGTLACNASGLSNVAAAWAWEN